MCFEGLNIWKPLKEWLRQKCRCQIPLSMKWWFTPTQAKSVLHNLEQAACGTGLHINADKYMCFNQRGDIYTLKGRLLKPVDKFTNLGSSVSSTENDINTRLAKAWTVIDRISVIWKSGLTDKIKRSIFQAEVVLRLLFGCTTWTLTKRRE